MRALLGKAIDYAGMFPPAKLTLDTAVRNYVRYQNGREDWIVDRFVCPAQKVAELEANLNIREHLEPFPACLIGAGGDNGPALSRSVASDIARLRRLKTRGTYEVYEVKLPASVLASLELGRLIIELKHHVGDIQLFLEVPFTADWRTEVPAVLEKIAGTGAAHAKVRTGGLDANAFPSAEQLAFFLLNCARLDLPFKATAGLHHPIRNYDESARAWAFGFINVFFAAAMAFHQRADEAALVEILLEEDARTFEFRTDRISWRTLHLPAQAIEPLRKRFLSFGSCSVKEPLDDLAALGHFYLQSR